MPFITLSNIVSTLHSVPGILWWSVRHPHVALWRIFEAFSTFMEVFWTVFGVALLLGMWGLLFLNTLARWFDWSSVGWSMEIVGFMIAWSIFVMAGPVTRHNAHIKVTLIPEKLLGEKRATVFINGLECLAGLAICIYLSIPSFHYFNNTRLEGWTQDSVGGWTYPLWIIRSGIFWGFVFCSFYYFERSVKWIQSLLTSEGPVGEKRLSE